jgi:hypothetical protein
MTWFTANGVAKGPAAFWLSKLGWCRLSSQITRAPDCTAPPPRRQQLRADLELCVQMNLGECLAGVLQGRREEQLPERGVLLPAEPEFPPRDRADFLSATPCRLSVSSPK